MADIAMEESFQSAFVRDAIYIYNTILPDTIASIRVVALIPARHIGLRVLHFSEEDHVEGFLEKHRPSVLILTKAFDQSVVELAQTAATRGIPVVTTLCDLHFSGESGNRNRRLCELSKAVVVQTVPMAEEVMRQFGVRCTIIEEIIEYPRQRPQFTPGRPLKVLWYGHEANHDTLAAGIVALSKSGLGPLHFRIVSNALPDFMAGGFPTQPRDMDVEVVQWSVAMQYSGMAWCDLVFIPSSNTLDKRVKGHNRVVEAINAGRLAIAYPLPQYRELADYCFCNDDYGAAIRSALAEPQAALNRIEGGQRYIDTRFAAAIVADKWRRLIGGLPR
jgi:hypothetical protein